MDLVESLVEFLGAFKSAESLSPELRVELTVRTKLEDLLLAAATSGRTVLITGAAGSGKTHLLNGLRPPKGIQVADIEEKPKGKHLLIVPDATELSVDERITAAKSSSALRVGKIIAINEGPLRETAQAQDGGVFRAGVELLHRAQRGSTSDFDPKLPTVIDMGAFDPIQQGVLADILALPLLMEVVSGHRTCSCPADDCPRLQAWRQLASSEVRARIARVCKMVLLADSDWSFRDLWDFVADLALGGTCDNDPPTSTWFWRVFYGTSRMSLALNEVCDPESLALPAIDQRLWYGDWDAESLSTLEGADLQITSKPDDLARIEKFQWLRAQILLISKDDGIHDLLYQSPQHRLQRAAVEYRLAPLVEVINAYMSYDMLPPASSRLHLWIDHGVERRTERPPGQVLGGVAEAGELTIRASQVVVNHPALSGPPMYGSRRFLVHEKTGAALELTHEKLTLLESRRSFRRADRRHTDLEFDLMRFFSCVLAKHSSNEIGFLKCDFKSLTGELTGYTVSKVTNSLEER